MKKRFSLMALLLTLASSSWATVADGSEHFLYNVGAQKWLNFGNPQGMTATFFKHGAPIKLTVSDNGYVLDSPFYDSAHFLGASGTVGASATFTITSVGDGLYTIQGTNGFLGWDGTTDLNQTPYSDKVISTNLTDGTSVNAQWQILTTEEMTARLASATEDTPVDATFLIHSPNMHRHDAGCYDGKANGGLVWTGLEPTNHGYSGYTNNYNAFIFNQTGDIYQDVTGLPAGVYEVRVQGFSRNGSNTTATGSNANDPAQGIFYAASKSTPLMKIIDDLAPAGFYEQNKKYGDGTIPYFNNDGGKTCSTSNSEAGKAFDYGMYDQNVLRVKIGEGGTLRIGVKLPTGYLTNSWVAFDNFSLTYYGPSAFGIEEIEPNPSEPEEPIDPYEPTDANDKTGKIVNRTFDNGKTGWKGDFGTGAVKATDINPLITAYGGTFNVYQDIEGLEPGTYKLKVQAFTRPMDHNDFKTAVANGSVLNNETYLYANEQETLVMMIHENYGTTGSWGADVGSGHYIPNSSSDAAKAFNEGLYENELLFIVKDGKARIGIRQEATSGTPYVGYDNFRLYYVSSELELPKEEEKPLEKADVLALLKQYNKVAAQALDHTAFDAVYAAATESLSSNEEYTTEALLKTKSDVQKALATLLKEGETENGQFDLTSLIANADFKSKLDGWDATKPFTWNSTGMVQFTNANTAGQLKQVLENMPAGKYTLKAQAFYRQSGWKEGLYEFEHGNRSDKLSLFLNDTKKPVKSLFEDARSALASANVSRQEDVGANIEGRGFPHMISKVGPIFGTGHYWNYIEVNVAEDGDITLGADFEETNLEDNWAILDNFRLYYGELKPVTLTKGTPAKDVTPAKVTIAKSFVGGEMTPFAAPCDIPGSLFKAVYEIGKLDYNTRTMTLFPVENVRAGIPCVVITAEDMEALEVGETVISAAVADTMQLAWNGGVIFPYPTQFTWRNVDPTKATPRAATAFTNYEIQELDNMNFTATLENFQIQRFMNVKYTQSSSSVVSEYNKPAPARRDLAHAVAIPVPASKSEGAVVKYSLNEDMSEAKSIDVLYGATICYIPNLVPDNTYYFEVCQGGETAVKGQFTTEGPLRMLYAPSVYNIRDFGGWTMQDGRKTRYGLIYRGGEVNGFHAPYQKDVETLKELGIGAEIDLRYNDSYDQDRETNKSGFGFIHGDSYYFAGANDYTADNLRDKGTQARLKEEFQFLMRHIREGKGVYFHCVFGADRTGFFAVLLQGLLGFTLNDMYHDYEFTSFAAPAGNRNKSSIQERIAVIQAMSGKTLRDKYENYWVNTVGITQDEVEEFRNIMLYEPAPDAINDIIPDAETSDVQSIKAVYGLNGMKMSTSSLNNKSGIYVVEYNNGTNKKMVIK